MLKDSQLDLCGRVDFARTTPLLARDEAFSFACAGCGGCCRGREDIVLSGFDLWRIAGRLRLPPQTVARAFCRASIGQVSHQDRTLTDCFRQFGRIHSGKPHRS